MTTQHPGNCTKADPRECRRHAKYYRDDLKAVPVSKTRLNITGTETETKPSYEKTGASLNKRYALRTRLPKAYEAQQHTPVLNIREPSFPKPTGGLWISPEYDGRSEWDRLMQDETGVNHHVSFADNARVIVIDSKADYLALLARYPHYLDLSRYSAEERSFYAMMAISPNMVIDAQGNARRGLDYEAIARDHDALFVTRRGLNECGRRQYLLNATDSPDVSLYLWDIESGIVFNPAMARIEPASDE